MKRRQDKRNGVKVVTIGGGTGSFMVLSGLKNYTAELTAIVSMVDDGGSTGKLRDEFGTLPSGDVRQCLVALADSETVRELFMHRFESEGNLSGHSFGNLFISALEQVTGSFSDAVETAGHVLNIKGQVVPVTLSNVKLKYTSSNGQEIVGEHLIGDTDLLAEDHEPNIGFTERALLNPSARNAILRADLIVLAPGTLYGSLTPALMVEGMKDAIAHSKAQVVYIGNLTTDAETTGYDLEKIYNELVRFEGSHFIDYILANNSKLSKETIDAYKEKHQSLVKVTKFSSDKPRVIEADLLNDAAQQQLLIRHDPEKVARAVMKIYFS